MHPIASIVVATDFSDCSAVALGHAIRLGQKLNARVHAAHVIDTLVVIEIEEALAPMQKSIREGLMKDAEAAWRAFAAKVPGASGLPLEISINNRSVGILRRARQDKADLLILGAFGDRRPDVGVGTVATACVQRAHCDVLLVRDTQKGPFRRIAAGVDFSPTSLKALQRAAHLAALDGAELHAVHCFEAPWTQLHYRAPTPQATPQFEAQYRDALNGRLQKFVQDAIGAVPGIAAVKCQVHCLDGGAHRAGLAEFARQHQADLIVLGTRGRSNMRDLLLGSTAQRTLLSTSCSVLAVRHEATPTTGQSPADDEPHMTTGLKPTF